MGGGRRAATLAVLAGALLLAVGVGVALQLRESPAAGGAPAASAPSPPASSTEPPGAAGTSPSRSDAPTPRHGPGEAPLKDLGSRAAAWSQVDLEAVRAEMPRNLYWKLGLPTEDAALLEERRTIRDRRNAQYGKVLSNTATAEEVDDYYAWRHRLSADYVEFTTHVLDRYRDVLPERDVGLLEMARELHLARLEEIPRRQEEAHERREAHAAARAAWLRDQARFEEGEAAGSPSEPD